MDDEDEQVDQRDEVEERARDRGADDVRGGVETRGLLLTWRFSAWIPKLRASARHEDDARVTEGEREPDAERSLAVADQLAGRVVDRRDVVGVERMAHPKRVGQDTGAESKDLRLRDVQVSAQRRGQQRPADHIQRDDHRRHRGQPDLLLSGEPPAPGLEEARASLRVNAISSPFGGCPRLPLVTSVAMGPLALYDLMQLTRNRCKRHHRSAGMAQPDTGTIAT